MQKYLLTSMTAFFILFLSACQHGNMNSIGLPFAASTTSSPSLVQSVQTALSQNDDPQIAALQVESIQDTIVLTGYVKKIRQSDTAEQIAHQVPGVARVQNHIIVRP